MAVTITAEINTQPRGPIGPAGPAGNYVNVMDAAYGTVGNGVADDTDAIQAAIDAAAISTTTRTVFFPPGIYKGNWTLPMGVRMVGCGCMPLNDGANDGTPEHDPVTKLIPQSEASAVIRINELNGQTISGFSIRGVGRATSSHGVLLRSADNDPTTFLGVVFCMTDCLIADFTVGIEINRCASHRLQHVWGNRCATAAFKFTAGADTITMDKCGGGGNDGPLILAANPLSLIVDGGEWGNGPGPVIRTSGVGQINFRGNNVELVTGPIIETTSTSIDAELNRTDCPDSPSFIRQMNGTGDVNIRGGYIGISGSGFLWESITTARAPAISGFVGGPYFLRWSPTTAFASTSRQQHVFGTHVRAAKVATQAIANATMVPVTFPTTTSDRATNFDGTVLTAPSAGVYSLKVHVTMQNANANTTYLFDTLNGNSQSAISTLKNHGTFAALSGSIDRLLAAGDTFGVMLYQDSGGSINVYGTGAGTESTISITKLSD